MESTKKKLAPGPNHPGTPRFGWAVIMLLAVPWPGPGAVRACEQEPPAAKNLGPVYDGALEAALGLHALGKFQEAGDQLARLVEKFPDGREALYYLGLCRIETKQWKEAREALKRFAELAPENPESRRFIGDTFFQEQMYALAAVWYEKSLAIDPKDDEVKDKVRRAKAFLEEQRRQTEDATAAAPATGSAPPPAAPAPATGGTPPSSPAPSPKKAGSTMNATPTSPAAGAAATKADVTSGKNAAAPEPAKPDGPPQGQPSDPWNVWDWPAKGVVGHVDASYQLFASVGGAWILLFVWRFMLKQCVLAYRLPFTAEELGATNLLCFLAAVALYVVWWGYASGWGWLWFVIAALILASHNATVCRAS
jgi:Tetratricopeptide repeat